MQFPRPLIAGTLVRRYQRFFADVRLADGSLVTAHCPNTGSMLGVAEPGWRVWLSPAENPKRKLRHTWELIEDPTAGPDCLVGINPLHPNRLAEEAIAAGAIAELAGYPVRRREVKYGTGSRVDLLLEDPARAACYVEVKNVHLRRQPGLAEFPDAVTERGAKHLAELAKIVAGGGRAVMLYIVQRPDCSRFAVAADIDPAYALALHRAVAAGVEVLCYGCAMSPQAIVVNRSLARVA
ncbi:MAG: DNA/RNA nuclease SfsA [Alphaproteobacteria bacterium]|nr:DNA/RNA nuclease SfsA [Alphaproteobacteria bacterium]